MQGNMYKQDQVKNVVLYHYRYKRIAALHDMQV